MGYDVIEVEKRKKYKNKSFSLSYYFPLKIRWKKRRLSKTILKKIKNIIYSEKSYKLGEQILIRRDTLVFTGPDSAWVWQIALIQFHVRHFQMEG